MKFLLSEHKSMQNEIENAGLSYSDFSFHKKRGQLNVVHETNGIIFSFHRKKSTYMDDEGNWTKETLFKVNYLGHMQEFARWDQVLASFVKVLDHLELK